MAGLANSVADLFISEPGGHYKSTCLSGVLKTRLLVQDSGSLGLAAKVAGAVCIRALLKKTPPQMERLGINEVIREVLALTRNELFRGGVAAQIELAADVPAVLGDRVQLRFPVVDVVQERREPQLLILTCWNSQTNRD